MIDFEARRQAQLVGFERARLERRLATLEIVPAFFLALLESLDGTRTFITDIPRGSAVVGVALTMRHPVPTIEFTLANPDFKPVPEGEKPPWIDVMEVEVTLDPPVERPDFLHGRLTTEP